MTIEFSEGPAGCGKTTRIFETLACKLREEPLVEGQAVLALTYMHGSRRLLQERFRSRRVVKSYECDTFDRFAFRLVRRWRSLTRAEGWPSPGEREFRETCTVAGRLLEREHVALWVRARYPFVLIDEAQDLDESRLSIIKGLFAACKLFVAADEFQCLDERLRPSPALLWLGDQAQAVRLTQNRRTNREDLIAAAQALRDGRPVPGAGQRFRVVAATGWQLAAWEIAKHLRSTGATACAILTPARAGRFADKVVARLCSGPLGKKYRCGPYRFQWEGTDQDEFAELRPLLPADDRLLPESLRHAARSSGSYRLAELAKWAEERRSLTGQPIATAEVSERLRWIIERNRKFATGPQPRFVAMTVHQAKNREFENVVVIWPYRVSGDAEQKRRLLYNAVTRARERCLVVAQSESLLGGPPFA